LINYVPDHVKWLNIVKIEINVMDIQCTDRKIGSKELLIEKIIFHDYRNNMGKIKWNFTKMGC
jgi:hypothetical protein